MSAALPVVTAPSGPPAELPLAAIFACGVTVGLAESRPLAVALGLDGRALDALFSRYLPHGPRPFAVTDTAGDDAPEEPDVRRLLVAHGATGSVEETWLAAIIARRAQQPDHLWHSLGLPQRAALTALFARHFPALAARNDRQMKWKKFLYRALCQAEGIFVCRSPVCDICPDFQACFGPE